MIIQCEHEGSAHSNLDTYCRDLNPDGGSDSRRKRDRERNCFKAGHQVEGSFLGNERETLRRIGTDREYPFWLCDVDEVGTRLGYGLGGSRCDGQDELKRR